MLSNIAEKVIIAVLAVVILSVLALIWELFTDGGLIKALGGVSRSDMEEAIGELPGAVPMGAVVAFDLTEDCPEGWSEFKAAEKRTIVGALFPSQEGSSTDNESAYKYRTEKGKEKIFLTRDHIPEHVHSYKDVYYSERDYSRPRDTKSVAIPEGIGHKGGHDRDNVGWALSKNTDPFGLDDERRKMHTNMQPYIALYFCKRKEP